MTTGSRGRGLAAVLRLHSKSAGATAAVRSRSALERYYGVEGIPDTTLEQTVLDLLVDEWLPLPVCRFIVPLPGGGHFRIDFAYPAVKLADRGRRSPPPAARGEGA